MDDNEKVVQRIHQMCATIEGLGQELQETQAERDQARRWAAAWKKSAKYNRFMRRAWRAMCNELESEKNAEIARLKASQPCGHPAAAIIATEARGNHCGWCAEVAGLREVLRDVEWACDDRYCPACGGYPEQGHNMWCDLAAILERQP